MTYMDPVLVSLIRATNPHATDEEIAAYIAQLESGEDQTRVQLTIDGVFQGSSGGAGPLALNDDAGLARRLGMPLSHDSHFTN
ncbi:hypothetical protein AB0230_12300 [Microbacterium sp. NPDC089190]|uniref:hypothetical protein n=1 Tax=Microbacterium sp. NPDC089190 TaxID=3155063 RepID=UPI00344ED5D4